MKTALIAAIALLLGIFVGGLTPRAEVRRLRDALSEARAAAESTGGRGAPLALGMGSLFAARERADRAAVARVSAEPAAAPPRDVDAAAADAGGNDGGRHRPFRGLGDRKAFEAAKAAADVRAAQFRQAFLEEAHLPPEREAQLDELIKKMNLDFAAEAQKVAALVGEKGDKLAPREMVDVGVRMAQVYQRADDGLRQMLTPAELAAGEKTKFDVLTQVDLGAFETVSQAMERAGAGRAEAPK